jgi:uncharacterized protein YuzE
MRDRRKFQRTSKILIGKIMKIKIDKETDDLYFRLDDSEIVESEEVENGIILDFNKNGKIVGIKI